MAKIIELPKLSPTMEEGTLVRWAKEVGDAVAVDDLLAEVETDKATMEFRSFDRGTLLKKLVEEGAVARLGQPVAVFGDEGEDISAVLAELGEGGDAPAGEPDAKADESDEGSGEGNEDEEKAPAKEGDADDRGAKEAEKVPRSEARTERPPMQSSGEAPATAAVVGQKGVAGAILAPSSPRVRRIARERDIDLDEVPGSGERGRVREQDLSKPSAPSSVDVSALVEPGDTVKPASSMRRTIARRLTEAKQTVPHFYLEADLDVEALLALRAAVNASRPSDEKVSVNDLFVRACALALRAVPEANASWVDGQVITYGRVDVSVAVSIDDGLVTPVVRGADRLSVSAIAATMRDLAARARARKLKPEEFTRGTFSLSNLGMFQVDRFAAVINPPEGMILAVGAARDVPVVKGGAVVPGKRCAVTLSCDHRVVDGALGARWLQALRALVEDPMRVLA